MPEAINQAEFIAARFGGRGQLADALDVPLHRVGYWCRIGKIPQDYWPKILLTAHNKSVDVTPFDFIRHLVQVPTGILADG